MTISSSTKNLRSLLLNVQRLERRGAFDKAWEEVRPFVDIENPRNNPANLEKPLFAEVLLRAGVNFGFVHSADNRGEEIAKNLITRAKILFEELGNTEKAASCYINLAIGYKRLGETDESIALLDEAETIAKLGDVLLHCVVTRASIFRTLYGYSKIMELLERNQNLYLKSKAIHLKAQFLSYLSLAKLHDGQFKKAEDGLEQVKLWWFEIGNDQELSYVENNIANLKLRRSKFTDAKYHAKNSLSYERYINNPAHFGNANDTLATIYLRQDKAEEGLVYAEKAVKILSKTGSFALIDSQITLMEILHRLGRIEEMLVVQLQAIENARHTSSDIRKNLMASIVRIIKSGNTIPLWIEEESIDGFLSLELVLDRHLTCENTRALRVKTKRLKNLGIEIGDVVLLEKNSHIDELLNGDYVYLKDVDCGKLVGEFSSVASFVSIKDLDGVITTVTNEQVESIHKILGGCLASNGFDYVSIDDLKMTVFKSQELQ